MSKKTLGILGGVGPLATMFIGEMIVRRTNAEIDQDHVNMIITNNTNIPDRTAFILGNSDKDPTPVLISDVNRLQAAGADVLIMPCNTAHSFYEELQAATKLPFIHMIEETVQLAVDSRAKRVGILATTGTISTELYQTACLAHGLTPIVPDETVQRVVMSLIYDEIKAGRPASLEKWKVLEHAMVEAGCDQIILGCTELSIVRKELKLTHCIDSLLVLAEAAIIQCGYDLKS